MRSVSLLSLTFTAALAACQPETASRSAPEETASRAVPGPERDLTLQTQSPPAVEVASPVELVRSEPDPMPPSPAPTRRRPEPQPSASATTEPVEPAPAPILGPVATSEIRVAPSPAGEASSGHELAPGQTVMVLPATSGPSLEAEEDDTWLPSERPRSILVGGGGTCRPRRGVRSIGIAGRIPVGIPGRRLR